MTSFRPSELLFTQDSILPYFSNGTSIHEEIQKIKSYWLPWNRTAAINEFLPLEIGQDKYNGRWYCNNNRRLYMFRVLEKQGYVTTIKTVKKGLRPKGSEVGFNIRFRGGGNEIPLSH